MNEARRPGTISPKAKHLMASIGAIFGVLVNVAVFVGTSRERWSYEPSTAVSTGPRIILLGAEGRDIPAAAAPRARLGRPVPMTVLEVELDLQPAPAPKGTAPRPQRGDRGWAAADDWTPAEVWRRERLRPDPE